MRDRVVAEAQGAARRGDLLGGEAVRVALMSVDDDLELFDAGGACGRQAHVRARPTPISDPDEVETLLDVMAQTDPGLKRFVRIPRAPDGRLEPTALHAAIDHGFRIVRWHMDEL